MEKRTDVGAVGDGRLDQYNVDGTLESSTTTGLDDPYGVTVATNSDGTLVAYAQNQGPADDFMSYHTTTLGGFAVEGTFAGTTSGADVIGRGNDSRNGELFQVVATVGFRSVQRYKGTPSAVGTPSVIEGSQTQDTNYSVSGGDRELLAINDRGLTNAGNIMAITQNSAGTRISFHEIVSTIGGMTPGPSDGSAFFSESDAAPLGDVTTVAGTFFNGGEWRPGTDELFWGDNAGSLGISALSVDISLVNDGTDGDPVTATSVKLITGATLAADGGEGFLQDVAFDPDTGHMFVAMGGTGAVGSASILRYSPGTGAFGTGGGGWTFVSEFGSARNGGFLDIVDIPVPEPTTLALGVLVLAGLTLGNWRRRSRG